MKLPASISRSACGGYALLITLVFLVVSLVVFASLMNWTSSNSKITKRNNLFNQSQAAAESATEVVVATMIRDFMYQSLNPVSTYTASTNLPSQTGWPLLFQYSDTNAAVNTTSVSIGGTNWSTLPSQFNGLYGLGQYCDILSIATPLNVGENLSGQIHQNIWFGSIPVFQFAIFYNMDLEINPGASMTINGRVHSNNSIYATGSGSGTPLIFSTNVEAALQVNLTPSPLDPQNVGRGGNVNFLMTANNPLNNANSLSLPIGTNNNPATVIGILGLPPAGTDATSPIGQTYIYNEADIIVSNSATATLAVYYQNLLMATPQIYAAMDVTNIVVVTNVIAHTSVSTTNYFYSFVTNVTFYDYRESDTVKAVQFDVGKFSRWLTNNTGTGGRQYQLLNTSGSTSEGHGIDGVYIYNSIPNTAGQLPAVRVVNGQQLPTNGLTVATPFPIYVLGSYNTTTNGVNFSTTLGDTVNTRPAGIMGDAITILSGSWNDSTYTSAYALGSRIPSATTINAACLEGIVPSNGSHYSGGVENFLRLLENWSGVNLAYNGSIVVLFQSQYATSPWQTTGNYYNAPSRTWGFDLNFTQQGRLPPMTPQVRAIIRGTWATK